MSDMQSVPSGARQAAADALRLHERAVIIRMVLSGLAMFLAAWATRIEEGPISSVAGVVLPLAILAASFVMGLTAWRFGALPGALGARVSVGAAIAAVAAELVLVSQRVFEWGPSSSWERREFAQKVFPIQLLIGVVAVCAMMFALGRVARSMSIHEANKRATSCAAVNVLAILSFFGVVFDGKDSRAPMWIILGLVLGTVGLLLYVRLLRTVSERLVEAPEAYERVSMPF